MLSTKALRRKKIFIFIFLCTMSVSFIAPLFLTFLSSFKDNKEIFETPFSMPQRWMLSNYVMAWKYAKMGTYVLNSIMISLATVGVTALVATMASYVLARFNLRCNRYLSLFFLLGMMVPMHTILVPVAYMIGFFNLKNNLFALVLLYVAFAIPFSIFVLTAFMEGIEDSLEEAAIIDGASNWQMYVHIILPMAKPAIATVSIFNFLGAWNNVIFPLLFINNNKLKPISIGLLNFNGERSTAYGPLMAAIIITISVPFIVYLLFQEKVESGLSAGAIKG